MGSAISREDFLAYAANIPGTKSLRLLRQRCTLNDILAGTTCPPVSLADFELYLAFREFSLENLQFAVWFLDYQDRFNKLPLDVQRRSPDPGGLVGDTARRAVPQPSPRTRGWLRSVWKEKEDNGLPWAMLSPSTSATGSEFPLLPSTPVREETSPRLGSTFPREPVGIEEQPFREETLRIVATFMRPGGNGQKELPLDQRLRDEVLGYLAVTTHPKVFRKVYQKVYEQLEMSVQNFVDVQSTNINRPKQNYWYAVGLTFTALSLIMTPILIVFYPLHTKHPPYTYQPLRRGVRLAALPFATAGAMVTYSAWLGFCSEVFSRGSTQLKTWEMENAEGVRLQRMPPDPAAKLEQETEVDEDKSPREVIAPFAFGDANYESASSLESRRTFNQQTSTATHEIAFVRPSQVSEPGYKRPPVFGPERIVQDERIRAYHMQVLNDITWFGVWYAILFAVVVLGVPGLPPPS